MGEFDTEGPESPEGFTILQIVLLFMAVIGLVVFILAITGFIL